jgi:hypothetical protein
LVIVAVTTVIAIPTVVPVAIPISSVLAAIPVVPVSSPVIMVIRTAAGERDQQCQGKHFFHDGLLVGHCFQNCHTAILALHKIGRQILCKSVADVLFLAVPVSVFFVFVLVGVALFAEMKPS